MLTEGGAAVGAGVEATEDGVALVVLVVVLNDVIEIRRTPLLVVVVVVLLPANDVVVVEEDVGRERVPDDGAGGTNTGASGVEAADSRVPG